MRVNKKRIGDIYINTLFGDIWILNKIWNNEEEKEVWTLNLVNDDCQELLKYVKGFKKISNIYDLLEENKKLKEENQRLKERILYLERSNNRREDTIMGLRDEITEQKDYESVLNELRENAIAFINIFQDEKTLTLNYNDLKHLRGIINGEEFDIKILKDKLQELKESDK